ncbi:hypothetical protein AB4Z30_25335 [Paenibacillus sp. 2TAF8]|uniref:hypothetical protein n=1 Tax=Paenibacillus sp. 2TAF8 TaxID=3233020 RepID=UPI003F98D64F
MNQALKLKWHSIYGQILFERKVHEAWLQVKANKGAGGIEGETLVSYEKKLDWIHINGNADNSTGAAIDQIYNHLGHFALTGLLMPLLKKTEGSRIVVLSSLGHTMGKLDFEDLNWEARKYDTQKAYGDSKIANLYFTYELARRLKREGDHPRITAAHPGWTATDLQRNSAFMSGMNRFFAQRVHMGVLPTLRAAFDEEAKAGDFFGPSKLMNMRGYPVAHSSNKLSYDETIARELWQRSEEMTGIKF